MNKAFFTDQPISHTEQDRFDFQDYCDALTKIACTGATPITIGVFGAPGSGKTSLMRLITTALRTHYSDQQHHTIQLWFNASLYDKATGILWRSLLVRVLQSLRSLDLSEKDRRRLEDWERKLGYESSKGDNLFQQCENIKMGSYQWRFLEEFRNGFQQLLRRLFWNRNCLLVVFIDDLDLCLPAHALDVLETIRLFLLSSGCVVFLAANYDQIVRVIQERYAGQPTNAGMDYIDRLVQLPFHLPSLEEAQVIDFVAQMCPHLPPEVSRVLAFGLPPNPRIIKRTLNIFALLDQMASRRIDRSRLVALDQGLLAKVIVIQAHYRDLYQELVERPSSLKVLEAWAKGAKRDADLLSIPGLESEMASIRKYIKNRPLIRMLRIGTSFASLTPSQFSSYLHVVLPTGPDQIMEVDPIQQLWDDLLSGDMNRIRAGVTAVRQRDKVDDYAHSLAHLVVHTQAATLHQRLSAAWALGYLGDPRDFEATVKIPGGEFPFGKEALPYFHLPYRITRYLVTNAQYAAFLKANAGVSVPYVDERWARAYNWDPIARTYPEGKANFPVVLVTWEEAAAYCEWVRGRLPTQEEWERAARGREARSYPWGDEFEPECANTRESGLGSPTPVGVFSAGMSVDGLFDMAGNVWEWTASDYNLQTKVLRGGGWNFPADSAKVFMVERSRPDNRSHAIGFRVAFSVNKPGY